MFLTRYRPMGLNPFFREFDKLFADGEPRSGYAPAVDVTEEEDHFLIKADLPGVNEKDIEVKVHDGVLLLSGSREETREEEDRGYSYRERRSGSFCRQFRLGRNVDPEKIEAEYRNGVLEVKLPKRAEAKPRQITVTSN